MKKITIYNIGLFCLALIGISSLMAFDGDQSDEQKIDAAYNELVSAYKMEKDSLCKVAALEEAQVQFDAAQDSIPAMEESAAPAVKHHRSHKKPTVGTQTTAPAPTPAKVEPTPTNSKKNKMSGKSGSSSTQSKKDKMNATKSGSSSSSTSSKKDKMNRNK